MSPFESESEEETIEIDFNNKSIKGKCRAKDFPKQMEKVKEMFKR